MPAVDLIYDDDCPNVSAARTNLMRAFSAVALPPRWREWRRGDPALPAGLAVFGSPSIVVDGIDVGSDSGASAACCRLYETADGAALSGAPTVEAIASVLRVAAAAGTASAPRGARMSGLAMVPGVLVALLPKVTCPACWPAYAGVLSALGLSFLLQTAWLLPLTLVSLSGAIAVLAWGWRRGRGAGPLALGAVAALVAVVGKFALEIDALLYGGIAALVVASLWNAFAKRNEPAGSCPACVSADPPAADGLVGITRRES